jgi:hypothetical protein
MPDSSASPAHESLPPGPRPLLLQLTDQTIGQPDRIISARCRRCGLLVSLVGSAVRGCDIESGGFKCSLAALSVLPGLLSFGC